MKVLYGLFIIIFFYVSNLQAQNYWQQKADYKMNIFLDVNTNILSGKQKITYYNNSPDTLKELYFHLYWNAFKKGSYMHKKSLLVNRETGQMISNLSADEEGNEDIKHIRVKNRNLKWEEHDTILRLLLEEAIPPKDSAVLDIEFTSQVPLLTRRAGRDNSQGIRYSCAQWYPKLAEYDSEGWHHDEYAGREFYGVWGNFDVSITLDSKYIVASSGEIQNPEQVKCGYELGKIDTTIFNPLASSQPLTDSLKTWHFIAENVHDFAWAADDKFIHDITFWKNVTIHSLYTPSYRDKWKNVKWYAEGMLDFYSRTYGMYPYKTFTVVQAGDGGMEYPTIIFNLGYSPGLMAHEGGHQWFYGMLGNNESREAWLDEGIITYTTDKTVIEQYHYPVKIEPEKSLAGIFQLPYDQNNNYRMYWSVSKIGIEEPILTHSDIFKDDLAYSFGTYVKGSLILPMLEYVIGDSVFNHFMKRYFDEWHFKHPHSSDLQRLAEKESGMELDWFFDEWLRTIKTCDYAVNSFSGKWVEANGKKKFRVSCELENRDDIVMPVDIQFNFSNGTNQTGHIPINWNPKKEKNSILLPRWDWVDKSYSFSYDFDNEVESVEIDPSLRMKDLNRLNNVSGFLPPLDINFVRPINNYPPVDKYWITYRPSLWYSETDGIRIGLVEKGGYMGSHLVEADYANNIGLWYLTKSKKIDYDFNFTFPAGSLGKLTNVTTGVYKFYGIKGFNIEIDKIFTPWSPYQVEIQTAKLYFNYSQLVDNDFRLKDAIWERGATNKLGISYTFKSEKNSNIELSITGEAAFNSAINYSRAMLNYSHALSILPVKFKLSGGYTSVLPQMQDRFYLSSANPREQFENPVYRHIFFLSNNFTDKLKLNMAGGGNISSKLNSNISGKNLIAFEIESNPISFNDIGINLPFISSIGAIGYINSANVWSNNYSNFSDFVDDFYIESGIAVVWKPFERTNSWTGIIPELNKISLRINFPLILNRTLKSENYFDYRWNISIGEVIDL